MPPECLALKQFLHLNTIAVSVALRGITVDSQTVRNPKGTVPSGKGLVRTPIDLLILPQGMNLERVDLSNLDLRNINFKCANLRNCNLSNCDLTNCVFERADMYKATLEVRLLDYYSGASGASPTLACTCR